MKFSFRQFIFILGIAVMVVLLLLNFANIKAATEMLKSARPLVLLLAALAQILTYIVTAKALQGVLNVLGLKCLWKDLIKAPVIMLFLNQVLPSAGMSGQIYLSSLVKDLEIQFGRRIMIPIVNFFTYWWAFVTFFVLCLIYYFSTAIFPIQAVMVFLSFLILLFLLLFLVIFLLNRRHKIAPFLQLILKKVVPKRKFSVDQVENFLNEVHEGEGMIKKNFLRSLVPMFWHLLVFVLDSLTIVLLFFSFDIKAPISAVVIGFALALLLGSASMLPGGIGTFEAAMTLTYVSLGIQLAPATFITVIFRLFSYWLPMPIGAVLYRESKVKH